MIGPWEDFAAGGTTDAPPWEEFAPPAPKPLPESVKEMFVRDVRAQRQHQADLGQPFAEVQPGGEIRQRTPGNDAEANRAEMVKPWDELNAALGYAGNVVRAIPADIAQTVAGDERYYELKNLAGAALGEAPQIDEQLKLASADAPGAAIAGKVSQGLAGAAPIMALGMPAGLLGRLVSIGFSADMLRAGSIEATALGEEMGKPPEERDPDKITTAVSGLIQSGAFAPLAGAHGAKPTAKAEVMGQLATSLLNEPMRFPAERAPVEMRAEDFMRDRPADNQFPLGRDFQTPAGEPVPAKPWEEFAPVQTREPVSRADSGRPQEPSPLPEPNSTISMATSPLEESATPEPRLTPENKVRSDTRRIKNYSLGDGKIDSHDKNKGVNAEDSAGSKNQSVQPQGSREAEWRTEKRSDYSQQWESTVATIKGIPVQFTENGDSIRIASEHPSKENKFDRSQSFWINFDTSGKVKNESGTVPAIARAEIIEAGRRLANNNPPIKGDTYLRYGDVPKSGRSKNFVTGQLENGVSVYRAKWNRALSVYELADANHAGTAVDLIAQGKKPMLVRGEIAGKGSDGEPVLSNVQKISDVKYTGKGYTFESSRSESAASAPHPFKVGDKVLHEGRIKTVTKAIPGADYIGVGKRAVKASEVQPMPVEATGAAVAKVAEHVQEVLQQKAESGKQKSGNAGTEGSPPQLGAGGELGGDRPNAGTPPPPAEDRSFSTFDAAPMEMPEAVRVIRALTGVYPKVRERLGNFAGVFRHTDGPGGKGKVEILASQFDLLTPEQKAKLRADAEDYAKATAEPGDNSAKIAEERYQHLLDEAYEVAKRTNPVMAMKTIWHEIGHVVDWLPEHLIRGRGNLFGRIASLKNFLNHTLPFDPARESGNPITPGDKLKLQAEAEKQLRAEMGPIRETIRKIIVEEPEWQVTGVTAEDVQNILREGAGKDTPELTRWFAEQDSRVKADVLRKAMRGLIDERLAALGKKVQTGTRRTERTIHEKVGRDPTQAEILARFKELLQKEIKARNLADLATVKGELQSLIAWWRGTAVMPDYFKTSIEMYADAFSVWANNPAAAAARAPTYSDMMWNYLERKPEVKAVYDEIQRQIKSGEIMGERVRSLHEMWDADDARSLTAGKESRQITRRDFYDNVVYHFDRRFGPIYKAAQGYIRYGEVKEAIGTYLYRATEHERYLAAINQQVGKRLVEAGLDWNHDLGEYLYHQRVIHERFNIANPLGFTPKNSLERLSEMQTNLGTERWRSLEQAAQEYRALYEQHVVSEVAGGRMFTPELNKILTDRAHYATFAAVRNVADNGIQRILDTQYGTIVTPHIYKQIGNLGEIKNPATATVLKGLSLISASYRNTMKREVVQMLQAQDSGNIVPAKQRWNGKANENVIVDNHPDVGTIVYLEDGVAKAFYVRRVVADAVNAGSPTENHIFSIMIRVNGWMKGLFTQLNYAFWPVNMVRDTAGTVMQLPGSVLPTYLKNLPRALRAARDSVTHSKPNMDADDALRRKLVISQADPRGVWATADNEFDLKVASYGMDPAQWSAQAGKVHPIVKAWNYYRELGQTIERVNKISGMLYLDEKFPAMPEWKKREIIRERSGSPNFLERGASNPAVDMFFLFYNPWKEGVRSVAKAARENPYSFGAKATVAVLMPTVLQSAAVNGYLGDERKKQYASIPDYDLTNYLCVPLGWVGDPNNGKIAYLRLPLWEPARIAHGTLFQTLTHRGAGIASNAGGQLPTLNPIWQVGLAWNTYLLQGKNPSDALRGVNIMPKTTFEAGGTAAMKEMGKYTWNSLGGSIVYRFKNLNLESAPETVNEKFMALPVVNNALGRWIKISDRGLADADRATTAPIEQKRAQLRLAVRPIADKLLKQEVLTASERMVLREPYAMQYLQSVLPDLAKSRSNPQFRRLNDAPSAESKAAIAREMQK